MDPHQSVVEKRRTIPLRFIGGPSVAQTATGSPFGGKAQKRRFSREREKRLPMRRQSRATKIWRFAGSISLQTAPTRRGSDKAAVWSPCGRPLTSRRQLSGCRPAGMPALALRSVLCLFSSPLFIDTLMAALISKPPCLFPFSWNTTIGGAIPLLPAGGRLFDRVSG